MTDISRRKGRFDALYVFAMDMSLYARINPLESSADRKSEGALRFEIIQAARILQDRLQLIKNRGIADRMRRCRTKWVQLISGLAEQSQIH